MSSSLLEAIVQMLNAPSAYERLVVGVVVNHPKRGRGVIEQILPDQRRAVRFDIDGETHRYKPESLYKLLDNHGSDEQAGEMDDAAKEASRQRLSRTLGLSVVWDRPELVRKILAGINEEEPGAMREVCQEMQKAIALHRHEVLKLFLGLAGMTMENINMGQLYTKPDEHRFLSSNQRLQARLRVMVFEMSDPLKATRPHALYQKALNRLFHSISPILRQELHAEDYTRPNDVFYWLIMQGNEEMARDVWPFCDNPVHVALLGAAICTKMSQVITQGQAAMKERASRLQGWALGAMEQAPDAKQAHFVLERSIREDRVYTALDIALSTGAKKLLFQRHSISLIERWWRGDSTGSTVSLPPKFFYPILALEIVFPFINPLVWPKKAGPAAPPKNAYGSTVFYDALGLAFAISSHERKMVTADKQTVAASDQPASPASPASLLLSPASKTAAPEKAAPRTTKMQRFREILMSAAQTDASAELVRSGMTTWFSQLRAFYSIPATKFVWRVIFQSVLTALYVLLIMRFKTPAELDPRFSENPLDAIPFTQNYEVVECLWILCELGLWLDKRHQQVLRSRSNANAGGSSWIAYLSDALFVVAVGIRVGMEWPYADNDYLKAKDLYEAYQVLISLKAGLVISLDWMPFLSEYQPLGVLYIMVCAMVHDVITWILLFAVLTSAYVVMFMGLQNARMYTNYIDDYATNINDINVSALTEDEIKWHFGYDAARGSAWAPMWALFGSFDPIRYNWLVSGLMWSYCLIGSVVLVNLLVAMFADTYNKISEEAENEYVFLRCTRLFEFKDSILPLPPVLNLPIIFRDIAIGLYNWPQQTVCYHRIKAAFSRRSKSSHLRRAGSLQHVNRASNSMHGQSFGRQRRRSITTELPAAYQSGLKEKRTPTIYDGKLLAQEYLKQVEIREKDTVHALSRALRSELHLGMKQREDEFLAISTRVGGVETHLQAHLDAVETVQRDMQESLEAIKAHLLPSH